MATAEVLLGLISDPPERLFQLCNGLVNHPDKQMVKYGAVPERVNFKLVLNLMITILTPTYCMENPVYTTKFDV